MEGIRQIPSNPVYHVISGAGTGDSWLKDLDGRVLFFRSKAYAESTKRNYRTQLDSYYTFCRKINVRPVPATSQNLCRYVVQLSERLCFNSIRQYLSVVKLLHAENQLPDPLDDFKLKSVLQGLKRELGAKVNKKLPITPKILRDMLSCLDMNSILDTAIWAASLLSFYAMLRRSNVTAKYATMAKNEHILTRSDVSLNEEGVTVTIRWSKTIQFKDRQLNLPLPRLHDNPLCPFLAVLRHYMLTKSAPSTGPALLGSNGSHSPPLTTEVFVSRIKQILKVKGYPSELYAGHSFRRGGACHAFQQGVPIETIKQIGDWRSTAYLQYVFDDQTSLKTKFKSWLSEI